jgi:predicted transcriptional regulator
MMVARMSHEGMLSARERQVLDAVYALGEATVTQVVEALSDAPSRSAVRTFLSILEKKGQLKHRRVGREYVFAPVKPRSRAGQSAVLHVIKTFFGGSLEQAVAVYLSNPKTKITADELERLESLIREAREKGD